MMGGMPAAPVPSTEDRPDRRNPIERLVRGVPGGSPGWTKQKRVPTIGAGGPADDCRRTPPRRSPVAVHPARDSRTSVAVLGLVVGAERRIAVLDRPPPPLILTVPRHGGGKPCLECNLGLPTQPLQLAGIE